MVECLKLTTNDKDIKKKEHICENQTRLGDFVQCSSECEDELIRESKSKVLKKYRYSDYMIYGTLKEFFDTLDIK